MFIFLDRLVFKKRGWNLKLLMSISAELHGLLLVFEFDSWLSIAFGWAEILVYYALMGLLVYCVSD